jgi:hypothetical protein
VITFIRNANLGGIKIVQILTTTTTKNIGKTFYKKVLWKVLRNIKKIIFKNNFHIKNISGRKEPTNNYFTTY